MPLFSIRFLFPFLTHFSVFPIIINQINCLHLNHCFRVCSGTIWTKTFYTGVLESVQCICFHQLVLDSMLTQLFGIKIFKNSFILFIHFCFILGYSKCIPRQMMILTLVQYDWSRLINIQWTGDPLIGQLLLPLTATPVLMASAAEIVLSSCWRNY